MVFVTKRVKKLFCVKIEKSLYFRPSWRTQQPVPQNSQNIGSLGSSDSGEYTHIYFKYSVTELNGLIFALCAPKLDFVSFSAISAVT